MEINYLRTLMAVVNYRSFAKAGEVLGLSRSGVSLQINVLENETGVQIFDRSTRPPKLTADGQKFVNRARELLADWSKMCGENGGSTSTGILALGAVQTVVTGILPYALKRFRQQCPDIQIKLTTGLAHELEAVLRRGGLDALVLPQLETIHSGLNWQSVCDENLMVVAPDDIEGDTDVELLAAAPYIRFGRVAWGLGQMIDQELARRGIEVHTEMEGDTIEGIIALAENGLGVTILPQRRIPTPFPRGIRTVPFGDPPLTRTIGLLRHKDSPRHIFVDNLYEALLQVAKEIGVAR